MMFMTPPQNPKKGRPYARGGPVKKGRSGSPIYCRVSVEARTALKRYIDKFNEENPKTSEGAVIEKALLDYLEKHGFWPPVPAE